METDKIDDIGNGYFGNFAYIFTLHRQLKFSIIWFMGYDRVWRNYWILVFPPFCDSSYFSAVNASWPGVVM